MPLKLRHLALRNDSPMRCSSIRTLSLKKLVAGTVAISEISMPTWNSEGHCWYQAIVCDHQRAHKSPKRGFSAPGHCEVGSSGRRYNHYRQRFTILQGRARTWRRWSQPSHNRHAPDGHGYPKEWRISRPSGNRLTSMLRLSVMAWDMGFTRRIHGLSSLGLQSERYFGNRGLEIPKTRQIEIRQ